VPADLNSFANKIARKYYTMKDEPLLKLIQDNLNYLIEEKKKRNKWMNKDKN